MPETLAKYTIFKKLEHKMNIAQPIFLVEGNEIAKIDSINNIGYYNFSVKNYNEINTSKVGFVYTIEIISKLDETIKCELYKNDKEIELKNLKTDKMSIKGNEKIEEKYKLKIIYNKDNETKQKDILEEVQVKIHSEQVEI